MAGTQVMFYKPETVSARCQQPGPDFKRLGEYSLEFHDEIGAPFHAADTRVSLYGTPAQLREFVCTLLTALELADVIPESLRGAFEDGVLELERTEAEERDQIDDELERGYGPADEPVMS